MVAGVNRNDGRGSFESMGGQVREVLRRETTVVEVDVEDGTFVTVCGDVHGQFYDLCNIFEINGSAVDPTSARTTRTHARTTRTHNTHTHT